VDARPRPIESRPPGPPAPAPPVRVARTHHVLVRLTHWINLPLLLGLIASGLSIYWAAPVLLRHAPGPGQSRDYVRDVGSAVAGALHAPAIDPGNWVYDTFGLGTHSLAPALQVHWLLAYLFMLNGALYVLGLALGGGWRALLPRPSDPADAARMIRYYLGLVPMALLRRPWPHPDVRTKYNALQRGAYFAIPLAGALAVASGWAMHKPVQLGWLERAFVNYDGARLVHFACMVLLGAFVVPHVVLVAADGWDTFRSMVTGRSLRLKDGGDGH